MSAAAALDGEPGCGESFDVSFDGAGRDAGAFGKLCSGRWAWCVEAEFLDDRVLAFDEGCCLMELDVSGVAGAANESAFHAVQNIPT